MPHPKHVLLSKLNVQLPDGQKADGLGAQKNRFTETRVSDIPTVWG